MEYNDKIDKMSDLPDPLIHHIFSFLDMRLVVQTSSLSTRWRYIWASAPYLNFYLTCSGDDGVMLTPEDKIKRKCFLKFVDRVLICRDATNMQKFSLSSEIVFDGDHLHTWLIGALRRKVKELSLQLYLLRPFELPSSIFTSEITVLSLSNYSLDGEIQLPNTFCSAARIKSLELEYIKLPGGNSDGELVLNCPVLENLSMLSCGDSHLKVLTILSPLLKKLDFASEDYYEKYSFKINIRSANLTSFSCFCSGYPDISVVNLPSLVRADINISRGDEMEKDSYDDLLIGVLRGIHNVRALKLASYTLKEITVCPNILEMLPSLFQNLRDITVEDGGDDDDMASISAMANVLKIQPLIKSFVWDRTKYDKGDDRGEELGVHGMFYSLKKVEIRNPHGVDDELRFVGFLLERAIFLNEMIITTTDDDRLVSTEFVQTLLELPRSSETACVQYCVRC
ncbi:hypothetical protein ACHQM5_006616 [Ranunculus cassubicifolius]